MAVPAVTVARDPAREIVIAQGALAPRAPAIFALATIPTLLLTGVLFALVPLAVAAAVAALLVVADVLMIYLLARMFAATVRIRVTPGAVEVAIAPVPRRTVQHDASRLRRLAVAPGGVHLKLGRTRLIRAAVIGTLDDGRRVPLFVATGRAAADEIIQHLAQAIAELGGPTIAIEGAA